MDLSNAERRVLRALRARGELGPGDVEGLTPQETMSAASWLREKGLVEIDEDVRFINTLGEEGERFLDEGLPESRLLGLIDEPVAVDRLRASSGMEGGTFSIGLGWLRRKGYARIVDGVIRLTDKGRAARERKEPEISLLERLRATPEGLPDDAFDDEERDVLGRLRRRGKAISTREMLVRRIRPTERAGTLSEDDLAERAEVSQLTPEIIQGGGWRDVVLRSYDIGMKAPTISGGRIHPLTAIIEEVRRIFLSMGFTEIEGDYIESAFWCMDALFVPQDHPARDLQDTLYLDGEPFDLTGGPVEEVAAAHMDGGGTGSVGWGYRWSLEEARRRLLRTHTTVNTIRYLHEHPEPPVRVFSIDRVFRKESIDSRHLPEFYQIEGVAMEEGASFGQLMGLLREFYRRMGFEDIRMRPGYFPYTEPSLEVEVLFGGRWMELGGAGMFRPEVTLPVGIEHPVLAWGLGLERLAMLSLDVADIRSLYMSDIEWLRNVPLLRVHRPAVR